ncbi:MAG: hypothetical protein ACYSW8_31160 [Planctomycetota bacterium]
MRNPDNMLTGDRHHRLNLRNLLVGATLPEILELIAQAGRDGDDKRVEWAKDFVCDYYEER